MKAAELKQLLLEKRKSWHVLLNSPAGAELVEWFERNFDHDTLFAADNPHLTAFRLGQRDVVRLLKDLKEKTDG